MDPPPVQYAKTSDGVRIACWALGSGPPLLYLPPMPGHIQREWETDVFGGQYRSLASRYRVIRMDFRNSGLSERSGTRSNIGGVEDIDAVLDHLEIDEVAIRVFGPIGLTAITYAAQRPSRVSALVLSECFASFSDVADSEQLQALLNLAGSDYETFTEAMGNIFFGWDATSPAREYAAILRASMTQQEMASVMPDFASADVSDQLPQIKAKTLVLHHRNARLIPMTAVQRLVDCIPNARLVILEGETVAGAREDPAEHAAVDDFILGVARTYPTHDAPSGTAIILFLDIAGSTELTTQLGDAAYRAKERELDGALRQAIREAGGSPVEGKVLGDGVMAVFSSASNAIDAALRCQALGEGAGLPLHSGIHAGDVIREEHNVHGGAVQVAARIADASSPGEVLVSQTVRDLARTSAGVSFEDRGEHELKGVSEPVRVFAVRGRQPPLSE